MKDDKPKTAKSIVADIIRKHGFGFDSSKLPPMSCGAALTRQNIERAYGYKPNVNAVARDAIGCYYTEPRPRPAIVDA